jgi:hypothetical protein
MTKKGIQIKGQGDKIRIQTLGKRGLDQIREHMTSTKDN